MNKYAQIPDEIIDLHGYTVMEAGVVLRELMMTRKPRPDLRRFGQAGHVRIITGKALYRENGPVLRTFVKDFLNKNSVKFNQSKIQDGGEGALEVFF